MSNRYGHKSAPFILLLTPVQPITINFKHNNLCLSFWFYFFFFFLVSILLILLPYGSIFVFNIWLGDRGDAFS